MECQFCKKQGKYDVCNKCLSLVGDKRCPRCKEVKNKTAFGQDRSRNDGRSLYCRPCTREYTKEHRGCPRKRTSPAGEKRCPRCDRYLTLDVFPRGHAYCRDCLSQYLKAKRNTQKCIICNRFKKTFKFAVGDSMCISCRHHHDLAEQGVRKTCKSCGETKTPMDYHWHKHNKHNMSTYCKSCMHKYRKGEIKHFASDLLPGTVDCDLCKQIKFGSGHICDDCRKKYNLPT